LHHQDGRRTLAHDLIRTLPIGSANAHLSSLVQVGKAVRLIDNTGGFHR
jgi:hypothetical protein